MAKASLGQCKKFRMLVEKLKIPRPHVRGYLDTLWDTAWASDDPSFGSLHEVEVAAEWCGKPLQFARALLKDGTKFLDKGDDGRYWIHDWETHAPEHVKGRIRQRNYRARHASECTAVSRDSNVIVTPSVTPPPNPTQPEPNRNQTQPTQPNPTDPQAQPPVGPVGRIATLPQEPETARAKDAPRLTAQQIRDELQADLDAETKAIERGDPTPSQIETAWRVLAVTPQDRQRLEAHAPPGAVIENALRLAHEVSGGAVVRSPWAVLRDRLKKAGKWKE